MAAVLAHEFMPAVHVDDVRCHPDNPRRGDLDRLSASIERNDFYGALIVQRSTGFILAGNHRYLAAKAAGLTELPVIFVDVDADDARRIMVADNRTGDVATYDNDALFALLSQLNMTEDGLAGTGFDEADLLSLVPPEFAPSTPGARLDEIDPIICPSCGCAFRRAADGTSMPVTP